MSDDDDDQDKQHEPSEKKLEDARKKGEIPRSTDLITSISYTGFLIAAFTFGSAGTIQVGNILSGLFEHAPSISIEVFSGSPSAIFGALMSQLISAVAPLFIVPAVSVILGLLALRSLVFAPAKLQPKLSRISILANAKNKFGRSGLFEFAKSFTKLLIYSLILSTFLIAKTPEILGAIYLDTNITTVTLVQLSLLFLIYVAGVSALVGCVDYLWQIAEHRRKHRMSHKELMDEAKQSEGDPHMKQQRRQRGYDIATNQMLTEVPFADVILVNPQHYAVALKWSRKTGSAPVCVAKGVDEIAATIRSIAAENGVPIHTDPPTARALYATVEIGKEIQSEHYRTVAAAIRFAETMKSKVRAGWGSK